MQEDYPQIPAMPGAPTPKPKRKYVKWIVLGLITLVVGPALAQAGKPTVVAAPTQAPTAITSLIPPTSGTNTEAPPIDLHAEMQVWANANYGKFGRMQKAFENIDVNTAAEVAETVDPIPDPAMQATWTDFLIEIEAGRAAFNAGDYDGAARHISAATADMNHLTAQIQRYSA
jgi:hypothetical protein